MGLKLFLSDGTPRFFRNGREIATDYKKPDYKCEPPLPADGPRELFFPTTDLSGFPLNPGKDGLWARVNDGHSVSASYEFHPYDTLPDSYNPSSPNYGK